VLSTIWVAFHLILWLTILFSWAVSFSSTKSRFKKAMKRLPEYFIAIKAGHFIKNFVSKFFFKSISCFVNIIFLYGFNLLFSGIV